MGGANSVTIALPNGEPIGMTQSPTSSELKEDIPTARMITPTNVVDKVATGSEKRDRRSVVTFQTPEKNSRFSRRPLA